MNHNRHNMILSFHYSNYFLYENLSDLIVKAYISSDGTEANAIEVFNLGYGYAPSEFYAWQVEQTDTNNIVLRTGREGVMYAVSGSIAVFGVSDTAYYKVVVRKEQFTTKVYEPKAFKYDLSTGAKVHALPDASSYIGQISIHASGGTVGGNNLSLTTVSSQTIDGDTASTWKIEVEGKIVLEAISGNWEVVKYTDFGSDSNGYFQKLENGDVKMSVSQSKNNGTATFQTFTLPYTVLTMKDGTIKQDDSAYGSAVVFDNNVSGYLSTYNVGVVYYNNPALQTVTRHFTGSFLGTWK